MKAEFDAHETRWYVSKFQEKCGNFKEIGGWKFEMKNLKKYISELQEML